MIRLLDNFPLGFLIESNVLQQQKVEISFHTNTITLKRIGRKPRQFLQDNRKKSITILKAITCTTEKQIKLDFGTILRVFLRARGKTIVPLILFEPKTGNECVFELNFEFQDKYYNLIPRGTFSPDHLIKITNPTTQRYFT